MALRCFTIRVGGEPTHTHTCEVVMLVHEFTVAASEGATSHNVRVKLPTFGEASLVQRQNAWGEAVRAITVKVQGTLRRRLRKGVRGETLNVEAQRAFDAILNGIKSGGKPVQVVDANELPYLALDVEQVDALVEHFESQGFEVVYTERVEQDEEQDEDEEAAAFDAILNG